MQSERARTRAKTREREREREKEREREEQKRKEKCFVREKKFSSFPAQISKKKRILPKKPTPCNSLLMRIASDNAERIVLCERSERSKKTLAEPATHHSIPKTPVVGQKKTFSCSYPQNTKVIHSRVFRKHRFLNIKDVQSSKEC